MWDRGVLYLRAYQAGGLRAETLDQSGVVVRLGQEHDALDVRDDGARGRRHVARTNRPHGLGLPQRIFDIRTEAGQDLVNPGAERCVLRPHFDGEVAEGTAQHTAYVDLARLLECGLLRKE